MTKQDFKKHVILSTLLTVMAIAVVVIFYVVMYRRYSPPTENNTSTVRATVTDVYHGVPRDIVAVELSNGESLHLVYPWRVRGLYTAIGYDLDELEELLVGQEVECLRMDRLPWAVRIYVGNTVVDNTRLTGEQITNTRIGLIIISMIPTACILAGDVEYVKAKYRRYTKAEKKRARKRKRAMKKAPKT